MKYLTVKEAAKFLEIQENTLRNYLSNGIIPFKKKFNATVIEKKELIKYKERRK